MKVPTVFTIIQEVERLAERKLWLGFEPMTIPVAVYDGERTWLLKHPDPPSEFAAWPDSHEAYVFQGLHETVRANTATLIGEIPAAAIMLESIVDLDVSAMASIFIHEMFHVFQNERYPGWGSDIGAMFLYPYENIDLLYLRRLETEALRRAQEIGNVEDSLGWVAIAMALRQDRYSRLPDDCVVFERGTELLEGLAQYVERQSLGQSQITLPFEEYEPDGLRKRCYDSGSCMAMLLDRFQTGWKQLLGDGDVRSLDELLREVSFGKSVQRLDFTAVEQKEARARAVRDVTQLRKRRDLLRRAFEGKPGYRIAIRTSSMNCLRTKGMDPSNCMKLSDHDILHTRFLRLGNETTSIEMLEGTAMTHATGDHPLYSGFEEVVFAGLVKRPEVTVVGNQLRVNAMGLSIECSQALLTEHAKEWIIELIN